MSKVKIALFGASGMIGQRILAEALRRNHTVTAITRNPEKVTPQDGLTAVAGNILETAQVAESVVGHDVVISAFGPGAGAAERIVTAAHTLLAGVEQGGVKRLIVVGGAGSLEVAPGVALVSTPGFPEAYKAVALAHQDALEVYQQNDAVDWTYLSPAALIQPGSRTGAFRLGKDNLVTDADGNSHISAEDYAYALLDEVENGEHIKQRFTLGY